MTALAWFHAAVASLAVSAVATRGLWRLWTASRSDAPPNATRRSAALRSLAMDPTRKPRGNPTTLTPEALIDLEHLWCRTDVPIAAISALLSARYGRKIDAETHARRRGLEREVTVSNHPATILARLSLASVNRWSHRGAPDDNPVRKSDRRYPTRGGYTMIRGRL